MGNLALALFILLLFFCGSAGWIILSILILFICAAINGWWPLLIIIAIMALLFFRDTFTSLLHLGKKSVNHKTIKNETDIQKSLEINNETIGELVKLVGQMPDDGTPIYQSDVKGITSVEWGLYQDWFRRNADEYVIVVSYSIIRVKSKADKIKLINKLLKMKTDGVV